MNINSNPGKFLAGWASRNAAAAYREMTGAKTMTTEELKRRMYNALAAMKMCVAGDRVPYMSLPALEDRMEDYLEALRIEANNLRTDNAQKADALTSLKGERDDLRNKLQAFEFANKSAGELLRDALATARRQREYIKTLHAPLSKRKSLAATLAQRSGESASKTICVALPTHSNDESQFIADHLGKNHVNP